MTKARFEAHGSIMHFSETEMLNRATEFRHQISQRRTVRDYSNRSVPRQIIEECLKAAASAPSGANMQPWHFVVVESAKSKSIIRQAAEEEERDFYQRRAPKEWLDALAPLGTDEHKPFLESAPYLIAVFAQSWSLNQAGKRVKHYYVPESVGIACGILLTALHHSGLVTLTHTPSPMGFLNDILERPKNEKPYMLIVAGYPADEVQVPVITKKSIEEFASWR